jgi:hypothetical protein
MTQELAKKNQQTLTVLQSREKLQQQLISAEERIYALENETNARFQSGRKILKSRLDALRDTSIDSGIGHGSFGDNS